VKRTCGSCTLCCELVAVREIAKKSFHDCPHRRGPPAAVPGCGIYASRPHSCAGWSCVWLTSDPAEWRDEERPDRVGFVVDELVDLIRINGVEQPAAQIWVQRGYDDAWSRDPAAAIIQGLIAKGLAVLWRLYPGTHAMTFHKVGDRIARSLPTPHVKEELLGDEVHRSRRVAEIAAERNQKRTRTR
jgi:hypothetical protein